jgi:hypothetical protein
VKFTSIFAGFLPIILKITCFDFYKVLDVENKIHDFFLLGFSPGGEVFFSPLLASRKTIFD